MENKRPLIDFSKLKKKRFDKLLLEDAKKLFIKENENTEESNNSKNNNTNNELNANNNQGIVGTTEDYELFLDRIVEIISEKNKGVNKSDWYIPVPLLFKQATRSVWSNFGETCKILKREKDHLQAFILKELGTEGNIAGDNLEQLSLKGKYNATKMEGLIKKYALEYIRCPNCKSNDTTLTKNPSTRLRMLECNYCNTKISVNK